MNEMLELRGEDHVHEYDRQTERDDEILKGLLQLLGATDEDDLIISRQIHLCDHVLHFLHCIAKRIAIRHVSNNGDFALTLKAIDLICTTSVWQCQRSRDVR